MRVDKRVLRFAVLAVFIFSKFFYVSVFSLNVFNFTLSDLCLLVMAILIVKGSTKIPKEYFAIITISLILTVSFSIGSALQDTSIMNGLMNYLKRWASVIIVPIYIGTQFSKKQIPKMILALIIVYLSYIIVNLNSILGSLSSSRYIQDFNPNILGMVSATIVLFVLKMDGCLISRWLRWLLYAASFILIMAVSSRSVVVLILITLLLSTLFKKADLKYYQIVKICLLIAVAIILVPEVLELVSKAFPYSYFRLANTFKNGIFRDVSASSRLSTQLEVLKTVLSDSRLLIFGSGFGNSNLNESMINHGYNVNTADSMYVNIFAWSGILGFILFTMICIIIMRRIIYARNNPFRVPALTVSLFIIIGGLSVDTLLEPTINSIYFFLIGIFEIYNHGISSSQPERNYEGYL